MASIDVKELVLGETRRAYCGVYVPKIRLAKRLIAEKAEGLYFHHEPQRTWSTVIEPELQKVTAHNAGETVNSTRAIDVVVFPELSVPREAVEQIAAWSKSNNVIVIAGSHYVRFGSRWSAACPVVVNGDVHVTYKIVPSPFEDTGVSDSGLAAGPYVTKFRGSRLGNFVVFICSDFFEDDVRRTLIDAQTDIAFVIACHSKPETHHDVAALLCREAPRGLYVVYCNLTYPAFGDGKSAVFGLVHKDFVGQFKRLHYSDVNPKEKLWQSSSHFPAAISSFDLLQKRPGLAKTTSTRSNVHVAMTADFRAPATSKVASASDLRAFKVVALDLDGTLLRGAKFKYSWSAVWEELYGDANGLRWRNLMKGFLSGKQTSEDYRLWCEGAVADFRSKKITLDQIKSTARKLTLAQNAEAVLKRLKGEGYKLIVVSGGIDIFLYEHIPDADALFEVVYINELLFDGRGVVHSVKATSFDFEGKLTAIEQFCEHEGFSKEDVVYVGDSHNDDALLSEVGCLISVSQDPNDKISIGANYHIPEDDFERVYEAVTKGKVKPRF